MGVRVRNQRKVASSFYRFRKLTLIPGLGPGNPGRNNLSGFRYISLQRFNILVIYFRDTFSGEAAVLSSSVESGHLFTPLPLVQRLLLQFPQLQPWL